MTFPRWLQVIGEAVAWLFTDHDPHDVLHGRGDLYGLTALVHYPFPGNFGLPPADDCHGGGRAYWAWCPRCHQVGGSTAGVWHCAAGATSG